MAEGDGEGEVLLFLSVDDFLVVSVADFLVVSVVDFLVVSVLDFLVDDFFSVLAGVFSGAVVVAVSVLLVLQAPRNAATARQVME